MKLFKIYILDITKYNPTGEIHLGFADAATAIEWILANNLVAHQYFGNPFYKFGCEMC